MSAIAAMSFTDEYKHFVKRLRVSENMEQMRIETLIGENDSSSSFDPSPCRGRPYYAADTTAKIDKAA